MTLKEQKVDVTDQVVGKLKQGYIELYLKNQPIGKIDLTAENKQVTVDQPYETDGQKIYQQVAAVQQPDMKYTDCDEGGWC